VQFHIVVKLIRWIGDGGGRAPVAHRLDFTAALPMKDKLGGTDVEQMVASCRLTYLASRR
jgi:hypothetical protein